ncbi:hypothetical protein OCI51_25280 (plasmid) [Lysinibacillus capsici]|uniref:hypothetical protein n=1 Tax=Lysinibacillus capsici TaxID=2115968 RepID=UPI0021D7E0E1|nr:hypothetical protein [Lysinibacillus capsici]UYB49989.1 hypothetical protein OCI51_25280 [Lysinibacillus capsici]
MEQLKKIQASNVEVDWALDTQFDRYLSDEFKESSYLKMARREMQENVRNFLEDLWYYGCLSKSQGMKLYDLHQKQISRLTRDEKILKHLVNGTTYYTLASFGAVILDLGEYQVNYWVVN